MFTTGLINLYNRNIFKTSLYIYIFQDEKCRLMHNLSLSMHIPHGNQINLIFIRYPAVKGWRPELLSEFNWDDEIIPQIKIAHSKYRDQEL